MRDFRLAYAQESAELDDAIERTPRRTSPRPKDNPLMPEAQPARPPRKPTARSKPPKANREHEPRPTRKPKPPASRRARSKPATPTTGVCGSPVEEDDEPPEVTWTREEKRTAKKIDKAIDGGTLCWKAPGKHLLLSFVSDMHIAPGTPVDFAKIKADAERIVNTPNCYAILRRRPNRQPH